MDLQPVWDWFRVLHATTGIKLTIFYDAFDRARFFYGFLTSIRLMALCLLCSVAIGIVGAWVQGSRLKVLRAVTEVYIQFFRNTPLLVQTFFAYFGLPAIGLRLPGFSAAFLALGVYTGAFVAGYRPVPSMVHICPTEQFFPIRTPGPIRSETKWPT